MQETDRGAKNARRRLLSPAERCSEVAFGLIMVLSITGSLGVATAGREEVRTMVVGAIGCNLAWGIVDAVMYLVNTMTERRREALVRRRLAAAATAGEVRRAAAELVPEVVAAVLSDEELAAIRRRIAAAPATHPLLVGEDLAAAAAVFGLVFLCTLPVVLPFVLLHDAWVAMRASNGVAVVLLYLAGHSLGRFSGGRAWTTGLAMVSVGLVLVAITIALGG